jgi:hypothetical protein
VRLFYNLMPQRMRWADRRRELPEFIIDETFGVPGVVRGLCDFSWSQRLWWLPSMSSPVRCITYDCCTGARQMQHTAPAATCMQYALMQLAHTAPVHALATLNHHC